MRTMMIAAVLALTSIPAVAGEMFQTFGGAWAMQPQTLGGQMMVFTPPAQPWWWTPVGDPALDGLDLSDDGKVACRRRTANPNQIECRWVDRFDTWRPLPVIPLGAGVDLRDLVVGGITYLPNGNMQEANVAVLDSTANTWYLRQGQWEEANLPPPLNWTGADLDARGSVYCLTFNSPQAGQWEVRTVCDHFGGRGVPLMVKVVQGSLQTYDPKVRVTDNYVCSAESRTLGVSDVNCWAHATGAALSVPPGVTPWLTNSAVGGDSMAWEQTYDGPTFPLDRGPVKWDLATGQVVVYDYGPWFFTLGFSQAGDLWASEGSAGWQSPTQL